MKKKSPFVWGLHFHGNVLRDKQWLRFLTTVSSSGQGRKDTLGWERHNPLKRINIPLKAECTEFIQ